MTAVAQLLPVAETELQPVPLLGAGFGAVYREHFATVWRGLRRLGVSDASLEDAAQDVFVVVHRKAPEYAGRSALRTWIFGIVVRVAKDYRRAERRHGRRVAGLAAEVVAVPRSSRTPADEVERREANRVLHDVLATLDEPLRDVLVLVELEELSTHEAAEALGLRQRTCQRRLRAARLAFESALAAHRIPGARQP